MIDLFKTRLKARKTALGLTVMQIAERTGMPVSSIDNYLSKEILPNYTSMARLVEALECTTDYLFGFSDAPTGPIDPQHIQHAEQLLTRHLADLRATEGNAAPVAAALNHIRMACGDQSQTE